MSLLFASLFTILITVLAAALAITTYYKFSFNYWKKRGVPEPILPTFPFGTFSNLLPLKIYIGHHFKTAYDAGKLQGCKHAGMFLSSTPSYMPIDLEYIKNILQKDFNYFTDRGLYYNEKDDPLSANLFAIGGQKWRFIRTKLSPAFISAKLKAVFDIMLHCGYQMQDEIEILCNNNQVVDIKDISECFTIDAIGSCAFGLNCNCFKYPDAEFKKQGRRIFYFNHLRIIKSLIGTAFPKLALGLGIRIFDEDTTHFFVNLVKATMKYRETNNVVRKDFLQMLFELRKEASVDVGQDENKPKNCLTMEELTAQAFVFFAAGFETSSITLAFCFHELATNPDIQDKVREEINRYGTKINYDAIANMKYMNQVVEETLRKYPPLAHIDRVCVKDYRIPGTETVIEKGIKVIIPILALHHDPEYYPNPEKFDPERFSEENNKHRLSFTYLPFGEGPRICIGQRFGLLQVKVGLAVLLKKYRFSLNEKTTVPLQIKPLNFTLTSRDGIFLDVEKINRVENNTY